MADGTITRFHQSAPQNRFIRRITRSQRALLDHVARLLPNTECCCRSRDQLDHTCQNTSSANSTITSSTSRSAEHCPAATPTIERPKVTSATLEVYPRRKRYRERPPTSTVHRPLLNEVLPGDI
ncbi:hypothetical protein Tcan_01001, partial [Toxocara canis]